MSTNFFFWLNACTCVYSVNDVSYYLDLISERLIWNCLYYIALLGVVLSVWGSFCWEWTVPLGIFVAWSFLFTIIFFLMACIPEDGYRMDKPNIISMAKVIYIANLIKSWMSFQNYCVWLNNCCLLGSIVIPIFHPTDSPNIIKCYIW